jgi:hypothetical protein
MLYHVKQDIRPLKVPLSSIGLWMGECWKVPMYFNESRIKFDFMLKLYHFVASSIELRKNHRVMISEGSKFRVWKSVHFSAYLTDWCSGIKIVQVISKKLFGSAACYFKAACFLAAPSGLNGKNSFSRVILCKIIAMHHLFALEMANWKKVIFPLVSYI